MNAKTLRQAINKGDVQKVKEHLLAGIPVNISYYWGWSPLHVAVKAGKLEVVKLLVESEANLNGTSEMNQTALDLALERRSKEIAKLLISAGGLQSRQISLNGAVAAGDLKEVKRHLRNGSDINKAENGVLPLCAALEWKHWDVATYFLKKGADVDASSAGGERPLHWASHAGAPESILTQICKRAETLNPVNDSGETPLACAARAGQLEIVKWLVDRGAELTGGRESPVTAALANDHREIASYLIDCGAKFTLHEAVQCNNLAGARAKLNAGADVNNERGDRHIGTPLEVAIENDSVEMVTLLLELNADPNQQGKSYNTERGIFGGYTPLHEAVRAGSAKLVKLLLANNADPDIANASGLSAIELAERMNRSHLAKLMEAHLDKKLSLQATEKGIDQLYTVQKVADLLSVDVSFVLELIKARKITSLKLNEDTVRIPAGSVQRYLAKIQASSR